MSTTKTNYEPVNLPNRSFPDELYESMAGEGVAPKLGSQQDHDVPLFTIEDASDRHDFIHGFACGADLGGDQKLAHRAFQVWKAVHQYGEIGVFRSDLTGDSS